MDRFPLLNTYRGLLQLAAILILLVSFFGSISASQDAGESVRNSRTGEIETEGDWGVFFLYFGIGASVSITFLVASELIKLAVFVEDHLYHIRTSDISLSAQSRVEVTEFPQISSSPPIRRKKTKTSLNRLEENIDDLSDVDNQAAVEAFQRGRAALENEQYGKAIGAFTEAINLAADFAQAYHYRALAHQGLGRMAFADADFEKARQLNPDMGDSEIEVSIDSELDSAQQQAASDTAQKGYGAYRNQQYERAIEYYTEAIKLDPSLAMAYQWRGLAYEAIKRQDLADTDYRKAKELSMK